jgi:Protein of unknown function (DUF559)
VTRIDEQPSAAGRMEQHLSSAPLDRVVRLPGVEIGDAVRFTAHAGPEVPAALTHRAPRPATPSAFVRAAVDDMESAAVSLFPAWLPEAENVVQPGGAGVAAVRALASGLAARSAHYGPFLRDLAALALAGTPSTAGQFTLEVRAAGLARVIAESFGRRGMVLVVPVPEGLTAATEHALVAGAEWLADRGRLGVWLIGAPLGHVDRVPTLTMTEAGGIPEAPPLPSVRNVIGKPHPASWAEAALEAALAVHDWASGRRWPAERCVVEIDGPEHLEPLHFEADRQRDVQLQLDGYAVLRFTNARIKHDVQAVVRQIGAFLQSRRRELPERTAT